MEVIITPGAKKQIKRLPKFIQLATISRLRNLKEKPIINSIKLSGYKDSYRIRMGDYRIVYRIIKKDIYIVLIAHRKEIYLLLKRLIG